MYVEHIVRTLPLCSLILGLEWREQENNTSPRARSNPLEEGRRFTPQHRGDVGVLLRVVVARMYVQKPGKCCSTLHTCMKNKLPR